jgi:hypothetical protein
MDKVVEAIFLFQTFKQYTWHEEIDYFVEFLDEVTSAAQILQKHMSFRVYC